MDINTRKSAAGWALSPADRLPPPYHHTRSYFDRGFTVIEVHGTIDLSTAPEVRTHIDAVTSSQGAQAIVDLRPVEFLDCSALSLLCRARRRVLERDGQLGLVCARPWHLRILQTAGLSSVFRPVATVEEALALRTVKPYTACGTKASSPAGATRAASIGPFQH